MNLPRIICPHNPDLLRRLTGYTIAVSVNDVGDAAQAAADVRNSGNTLFCVIVGAASPLDQLQLGEDLEDIPLAIMAPCMGKFRNFSSQLKIWRELNVRVYLPCDNPENLAALKILSSLGIHTCAVFANGEHDWDALADLMTYALLGRAAHAPIEPFAFIASHYDPFSWLEWGSVHFDDPKHFLHLDTEGRVALSAAELRKNQFIAQSLGEISEVADCPAAGERSQAWKSYFLEGHACACCPGWKICLGKFAESVPRSKACSGFFVEMMEVARQHKALSAPVKDHAIWQP